MAWRNISEADLEHALATSDQRDEDEEGNHRITGSLGDGRRIVVVIAKDSAPPRVVTLWPLGRKRK